MELSAALYARFQMGLSLGFHIVFASIGITMPILMCLSEWKYLRTRKSVYLDLTKAWAKGTAVFFAVGAVSGTVLAFELGLLFPKFMELAGPVIGLPFALEGFAFFTEAIFLGIYLYGWDRVSPALHLAAGAVIAVSGALSAAFVTTANAWMNVPRGFRMLEGKLVEVDPIAAMGSPFVLHEIPHTFLASLAATAFAVAGIHAYLLLRRKKAFHRYALTIALFVAVPSALLQPLVGHLAGQQVARYQPLKLAAMENVEKSERGGYRSFLAYNDFQAEVRGLETFPEGDRPSALVHLCFLLMVGLGLYLFLLSVWALVRRNLDDKKFLKAVVIGAPMGYFATEAGWIVTEVGRQPWVIYDHLRTVDSVTPVGALGARVLVFSIIYLVLGAITLGILRRYVRATA